MIQINRSRPIDIPRVNAPHAEAPTSDLRLFRIDEIAPPLEPTINARILEITLRTQMPERVPRMNQERPTLRIVHRPVDLPAQKTKLQKFGAVLAAIGASLFIPALTVMAMALPIGAAFVGACIVAFVAGMFCIKKTPSESQAQQDNSGNP